MTNFMKLTLVCECEDCEHTPIYINMDRVETMHVDKEGLTWLQLVKTVDPNDDDPLPNIIFVKEHPDEIMHIMRENKV